MKKHSIKWITTTYFVGFVFVVNIFYSIFIYFSIKENVYEIARDQIAVSAKTMVDSTTQILATFETLAKREADYVRKDRHLQHEIDPEHYFIQNPNINWVGLFSLQEDRTLRNVEELLANAEYVEKKAITIEPTKYFSTISKQIFSHHIVSPLTLENVVWLLTPVDNNSVGDQFVITEIKIKSLGTICRALKFGKHGHCVIADDRGVTVSHPNPDWIKDQRDISHWPSIAMALKGEEGITTFHSPFFKQDMLAGYAPIPNYGWTILIPQTQGELDEKIYGVLKNNAPLFFIILTLSAILAVALSRRFASPIVALAEDVSKHPIEEKNLTPVIKTDEKDYDEIGKLKKSFVTLLAELQQNHLILQNTLDHAPIFLLNFDSDGNVLLAVGSNLHLIGVDEISPGLTMQDIFTEKFDLDQIKNALQTKRDWYENRHIGEHVLDIWISKSKDPNDVDTFVLIGLEVSDSWLAIERNVLLNVNRSLLQQSYATAEKERMNLSRDLHDTFSQHFTNIHNFAAHIKDVSQEKNLSLNETQADIADYSNTIIESIMELKDITREMLKRLWPEELQELGLCASINKEAADYRKGYPGVDVSVRCTVNRKDANFNLQLAAYRVIQEGLTNAKRYSQATRIEIKADIVERENGKRFLCVDILDNGKGFDYNEAIYRSKGLIAMRERIAAFNGELQVNTSPNKGCQIYAELPISENQSD